MFPGGSVLRNQSTSFSTLLSAAALRLKAAGVSDPQRDARWLLREAAGFDAAGLAARMSDPAPEAVEERFEAMLQAREARRPVSHIIGRRAFYGRRFRIDARALDPRPESETLVAEALARLPADRPASVLDLGVGSGCLLLTVLAERPRAVGLGVDRSADALALAAENAALLDQAEPVSPGITPGIAARLTLRQGDWLDGVEGRFDAILCNPPYIDEAAWAGLAPEVRVHEPKGALTPGADGLAVYRLLAPLIAAHLAEDGVACFETGRGQAADVEALFRRAGLRTRKVLDLGGVERVVLAQRGLPGSAGL